MVIVRTDLRETRERAALLRFEKSAGIPDTNVQDAIETVDDELTALEAEVALIPVVVSKNIAFADSPYTVLASDRVLYVDTSGGAITINLQPAAGRGGIPLTVKDVSGNAAANNISIVRNGAETIDGLTTYPINMDFGGVRLNPRTASYTVAP